MEPQHSPSSSQQAPRTLSGLVTVGAITSSSFGLVCYLLYLPAKANLMVSFVALIPWAWW